MDRDSDGAEEEVHHFQQTKSGVGEASKWDSGENSSFKSEKKDKAMHQQRKTKEATIIKIGPAINEEEQEENNGDISAGDEQETNFKTPHSRANSNLSSYESAQNINQHGRKKSYGMNMLSEMFKVNVDNRLAIKLYGNKTNVLIEHEKQIGSSRWVIHPYSPFRWYWDMLLVSLLTFQLFVLPVNIAFLNDDLSLKWLIINGVSDLIFITDIGLNFNTGIIDHDNNDETILDRREVCRRYIRSWFVVDFVSSLPFDYVYFAAQSSPAGQTLLRASRALRIFKLAKLLSLLRLSRLLRYMRRFEELIKIASGQLRILKLIGLMMILSHWNGCLQFLVPYLQDYPADSWIVRNELVGKTPWEQYSWSLFNAMSHMLSIGYGRLPPANVTEAWLIIFSMTIGGTFYAIFIGVMSTLLLSIDSSSRLYNEKMQQVDEYMRYRKLPRGLRRKIRAYYEHKYQRKLFDEEGILDELSPTMREDVIMHNVGTMLRSVPFFADASNDFIIDVIVKLKFEVFMEGDLVCRGGKKGDRMYFVQHGIVDILTADGGVATSLSDGAHFGEISLLTNEQRRVATVRAATICDLFSLASNHLDEVLEDYPEVKEILETVAKERLLRVGINAEHSQSDIATRKQENEVKVDWSVSRDNRGKTVGEPRTRLQTAFAMTKSKVAPGIQNLILNTLMPISTDDFSKDTPASSSSDQDK